MKLKLFLFLCGLTACVPQSRVVCGGDGQLTELNDGRIFCGYAVIVGGFRGCPRDVPFRLELPNGYACSNRPIPSSGDLPPQLCAQLMCMVADGGVDGSTTDGGNGTLDSATDAASDMGRPDAPIVQHDWTWRRVSTLQSPGPRQGQTMAFDPVRNVVLLYGGLDASDTIQQDLWEWNGITWVDRTPVTSAGNRPYDSQRLVYADRTYSFGATMDNQWTYNGTTGRAMLPKDGRRLEPLDRSRLIHHEVPLSCSAERTWLLAVADS